MPKGNLVLINLDENTVVKTGISTVKKATASAFDDMSSKVKSTDEEVSGNYAILSIKEVLNYKLKAGDFVKLKNGLIEPEETKTKPVTGPKEPKQEPVSSQIDFE